MKKMMCILLILVLSVPFALAEDKTEGPGFATPQEAAVAYVNALKAGDVPAILSTFAIETYADHCDSRAYVERMKSVTPGMYQCFPATGPLSRGLWLEQRRNEIAGAVWRFYIMASTAGSEYRDVGDGMYLQIEGEAETDAYMDHMLNSSAEEYISGISVLGVFLPDNPAVSPYIPENYFSERNAVNRTKQYVNLAGCDEYTDVIVLVNINGMLCAQLVGCARYGDVWYNLTLLGNLAAILGLSQYRAGLAPLSEMMR